MACAACDSSRACCGWGDGKMGRGAAEAIQWFAAPGVVANGRPLLGVHLLCSLSSRSEIPAIAFLMLRAQTLGLSTVEIFLVVALFNLVVTLTSTKGGALSDTLG